MKLTFALAFMLLLAGPAMADQPCRRDDPRFWQCPPLPSADAAQGKRFQGAPWVKPK